MPTMNRGKEAAAIAKAYGCLADMTVKSVVVYLHPHRRVKLTRVRKPDRRSFSETVILTVGSPNYSERRFVRLCVKAGEKFPVRKVQLKFFPKKR